MVDRSSLDKRRSHIIASCVIPGKILTKHFSKNAYEKNVSKPSYAFAEFYKLDICLTLIQLVL